VTDEKRSHATGAIWGLDGCMYLVTHRDPMGLYEMLSLCHGGIRRANLDAVDRWQFVCGPGEPIPPRRRCA
jgi:hypothetical protein